MGRGTRPVKLWKVGSYSIGVVFNEGDLDHTVNTGYFETRFASLLKRRWSHALKNGIATV